MTTVRASRRKLSAGSQVRRLRLSSLLTQQELAEVAGVSQEEVNLLARFTRASGQQTQDSQRTVG